ncbi:MAG: NADPH:quinone reductase [Rubrivivax sp.]|jgi:NADPH2:quinone reductase|nr:NADPH:quinone reductase [Rubrivivax sp.]
MKAWYYERTGAAAEVLVKADLPTPEPGPGEVRVRIEWSGVNPSDVKSRGGLRPMPFPRVIPHSDGSGTIDAVGAGVDARGIGQRVWLWNAAWGRPFGTAAEYCCVPAAQAVPLPDNVPGEVGACMGIPGLTAMHAVLTGGGVAGRRVLVAGGAGAVGHYVVQLASRFGAAQVIATTSSEAKARLALDAGADCVIDYRTEPVAERVRELTGGRGIDRVIELDLAANGRMDLDLLRTGGELVVYGSSPKPLDLPFAVLLSKNLQLAFFMVYHLDPADRARAIDALQRLLARGELQHNIAERRALDDLTRAHEAVESGRLVGNLVLGV